MEFNLIDRPWIPVLNRDGHLQEVGLRQLFTEAHQYRELYDGSPLVLMGLVRLLLAILHRAYNGPRNHEEWHEIYQAGSFDMLRIGAYLDKWHDRFDICSSTHPFYQLIFTGDEKSWPITRLALEKASKSSKVLFDHTLDREESIRPAASVARWLLASQTAPLQTGPPSNPFISGPIPRPL